MRMLMKVSIPNEPFNAYVKDGSIEKRLGRVLDEIKPEAVYFTEMHGQRGGVMIVDVPEPSRIPALSEPWFLMLKADVEFHIVMNPEDLRKAGLDALGKKWA